MIYLFLIKNQKQTLSEISKKLLINRPKLYKILPSLEESGLITKILIGKRIHYIAENPENLYSYFHTIKNDFDIFIPEIKNIYENNFKKPILKNIK